MKKNIIIVLTIMIAEFAIVWGFMTIKQNRYIDALNTQNAEQAMDAIESGFMFGTAIGIVTVKPEYAITYENDIMNLFEAYCQKYEPYKAYYNGDFEEDMQYMKETLGMFHSVNKIEY